jgi:hypothetical protein
MHGQAAGGYYPETQFSREKTNPFVQTCHVADKPEID